MPLFSSVDVQALGDVSYNRYKQIQKIEMEHKIPIVLSQIMRTVSEKKESLFAEIQDACRFHVHPRELNVDIMEFSIHAHEKSDSGRSIYWHDLFKKTDIQSRLSNLLSPGHFECRVRVENGNKVILSAHFYPKEIEIYKGKNLCYNCTHLVDGICQGCGGFHANWGTPILNPEDEDEDDMPPLYSERCATACHCQQE
jgi:hypothetical protein